MGGVRAPDPSAGASRPKAAMSLRKMAGRERLLGAPVFEGRYVGGGFKGTKGKPTCFGI